MEPAHVQSTDKINQAIHLLEEATNGHASDGFEKIQAAVSNFEESASKRVQMIDDDAHERPWRYMAVTAATCIGLGVLLGRRFS